MAILVLLRAPRLRVSSLRRGRRSNSLGRRFLWKFRRRCLHYPAIRRHAVDPPFYRSGRRGVRVDPSPVEAVSPTLLGRLFLRMRKEVWSLRWVLLPFFSSRSLLFPIFLSGFWVYSLFFPFSSLVSGFLLSFSHFPLWVGVWGFWGFSHLPYIFDRHQKP